MLPMPRRLAPPGGALVAAVIIAGCISTPVATPTDRPKPEPSLTPTLAAAPTPSPTAAPTASPTPMPTVAAFEVAPNPDADALFAVRDTCTNPSLGYELEYPENWWTNTAIGDVPACSWFSPTFYEVPDPSQRPSEIAIEIISLEGGYVREPLLREDGTVDGQPAVRVEWGGTAGNPDFREYAYIVQLGETPEEGPDVIARTDTNMGGDYTLNKAALDRIMATLQFMGGTP